MFQVIITLTMIFNLSEYNTIASLHIAEMRDAKIQRDKLRFRNNMRRTSRCLAYELSKSLKYHSKEIETPLGSLEMNIPETQMVLVPILRSGLAMHQGMLDVFEMADSSFMSISRIVHKDASIDIQLNYVSSPVVTGKDVILLDPMIATGSTILEAYRTLRKFGQPNSVHAVAIISSVIGIEYLQRVIPELNIWTGAIDEELTAKSWIVPGLGNVGELCFGSTFDPED